MTHRFQFIPVPDPTERISPQSRKLAHSHALRQRHAKERRSRTKAYQDKIQVRQSPKWDTEQPHNVFQSRMLSYYKDPFSALIRPLTSQEYFLLNHYVSVSVPYKVLCCSLLEDQILKDWVGLAMIDENLLESAIFLSASQELLCACPDNPALKKMTLEYRQKGLCTLRKALSSSEQVFSLVNVAQALALAFDEVITTRHSM
ncbi:hypothetical protein FAVG1_08310 [Fusarium avenaceum]|nr:hypothetical protein FAVG1_08310 [Fusarium avenaceum]